MNYRTKQKLYSKLRRALRWEFWPMPIFYLPIVIWILFLTIRYRALAFLSVNPGLLMSGLYGERKGDLLQQLKGSEHLARFTKLVRHEPLQERVEHADKFMRDMQLSFPVVLKPDYGQRGLDVAIIRNESALVEYLDAARGDVLLQEHVSGEEFGVFYMRSPASGEAQIFSITEKTFPVLIGDGVRSFEKLLMDNSRTHYMASYLLNLHVDKLDRILAKGEEFTVVEIGSHCRGSVFYDGNQHITEELLCSIDEISKRIDGFFFGRYDIRALDTTSLRTGKNFKVLEVNGLTSESTNIYDPSYSILKAYRILFRQWRYAFEIGQQNIKLGATQTTLIELLSYFKSKTAAK